MTAEPTIVVQNFVGSALTSIEAIEVAARRIIATRNAGCIVIVVVSAMAGDIDRLLTLAHGITVSPEPRELDVILASGAQMSAGLVALALNAAGGRARSLVGPQISIHSRPTDTGIARVDTDPITAALAAGAIPVLAGCQGVDADGTIVTFLDNTAMAVTVAAALGADVCEIYTDVAGQARSIPGVLRSTQHKPSSTRGASWRAIC